jgi:hypothetical protein
MLQKSVIRALFGITRKERVSLFQLQLPLDLRVSLLNECIKICNVTNVGLNNQTPKITEAVAQRAYKRIVGDIQGNFRKEMDIDHETIGFPTALSNEITHIGYIDTWANRANYDHTLLYTSSLGEKKKDTSIDEKSTQSMESKIKTHWFECNPSGKTFWLMTIDTAFSDDFWKEYINAIDEMRFCVGLGGKSDAYVRCASTEPDAIFTTGGRNIYHALPMTDFEEKIIRLAKFVMSFQRSFVHRVFGDDYRVTWDANLLHHVVAPIASAVYSAHSDCSPFLNSTTKKAYVHIHEDVYLPTRGDMQVLTIHYSNYDENSDGSPCTTLTYTRDGDHIGSAALGSRGIHIQDPGSQSNGIKHKVTVCPSARKSGIY